MRSSKLWITRSPVAQVPSIAANVHPSTSALSPSAAVFRMTGTQSKGEVVLAGSPGDSGKNWKIGMIQTEWIETNWGYYLGQTKGDGSVFVQRARPPARPRQSCRDTKNSGDFFYDGDLNDRVDGMPLTVELPDHPIFPHTARVIHQDFPGDSYPTVLNNSKTHKLNFLSEVQLEFHFATILAVLDPTGRFQYLKHFYWFVHWQSTFTPNNYPAAQLTNFTVTPNAAGTMAQAKNVYDGPPTDGRYASVLASPQPRNCNDIAAYASGHPILKESTTWELFDVRR